MNHSNITVETIHNSPHYHLLLKIRNELAKRIQWVTVITHDWRKLPNEETHLDIRSLDRRLEITYKDLRMVYKLPIHFNEFRKFIYAHKDLSQWYWRATYTPYRKRLYAHTPEHGPYFRQGTAFRQDGILKKEDLVSDMYKVNRQEAKLDWHNRKKFSKDQSKRKRWCKCGRFLKDVDHRSRRAYERMMIGKQRFDEIMDHKDMFVSDWDAC